MHDFYEEIFDRQQAGIDMEYAMLERDLINMEQEQEMITRIKAARKEELTAASNRMPRRIV